MKSEQRGSKPRSLTTFSVCPRSVRTTPVGGGTYTLSPPHDTSETMMSKPTSDPNQMLSTRDAAALLGLQPCTLAAWREDGSQPGLAFFKLGKAVRYRYADLLAFIETRKASSTLTARLVAPPPLLPISRASSQPLQAMPAPAQDTALARPPQKPLRQTAEKSRPRKRIVRGEDRQQSLF